MRMLAGVVAVVASLLLAGCSAESEEPEAESTATPVEETTPSEPAEPETVELTGAVAVSSAHAIVGEGVCMAWGEFTDFDADTLQVVITDATGAIVATADAGPAQEFEGGCLRWFAAEVPAGGAFFTATVGDWKSTTYAEADLATTNVVVLVDG